MGLRFRLWRILLLDLVFCYCYCCCRREGFRPRNYLPQKCFGTGVVGVDGGGVLDERWCAAGRRLLLLAWRLFLAGRRNWRRFSWQSWCNTNANNCGTSCVYCVFWVCYSSDELLPVGGCVSSETASLGCKLKYGDYRTSILLVLVHSQQRNIILRVIITYKYYYGVRTLFSVLFYTYHTVRVRLD